jgi:hypothetical protein
MTMRARTTTYWIATGVTIAAFAVGGALDLARGADVREITTHLGYPLYLATILGTWKVLGALAIAAPGLPRLKEWAYAGMMFDLTGAAVSHAATGDPVAKIATPLVLLAIAGTSWALRPASRRLDAAAAAPARAVASERGLRAA